MGVGTQTAEATLFLQFEGDSEMEGALEVKGSCKSLDMFFGMCLISFVLCLCWYDSCHKLWNFSSLLSNKSKLMV